MQGLTSKEALKRLEQYGTNELKVSSKNPWWKMLLSQFTNVLVIILIIAALITWFHGEVVDTIVIVVIIVLNWWIWFLQEFRTEKTLEALQKMILPEIRVIRDGEEQKVLVKFLVPGDIVIISEWDKISADWKVTVAHSLKLEEAALTWESLPLEKKVGDEIYMGTSAVKGSGMFEVTKTGQNTRFWEIAKLAVETEKTESPLQKEIKEIGRFVAKITLAICAIIFMFSYYHNGEFFSNLMYSVSIAIAAVPEWLPTTITIALAIGGSVLAGKSVVIKKLSSVETLWAVTTICSDKTGTLTKNEMTVREIYLWNGEDIHISWAGYDPTIWIVEWNIKSLHLSKLVQIAYYCNDASIKNSWNRWTMLWDPTEWALVTMAEKIYPGTIRNVRNLSAIFPFDSDRKLMSVVLDNEVFIKWSPDHMLALTTMILDGETIRLITEEDRKKIKEKYTLLADGALRVLAFWMRQIQAIPQSETEAENNIVFVWLAGMIDPPREEAKKAVKECKNAWVRVIVITWDYGNTAAAIWRELGIINETTKNNVYVGADVEKMTDKKLKAILWKKESIIFSRSLPKDKMRIVGLLQELGEVVAMTWDGVNDAPALKKADIGIAMGITGTEVSKESATMILLNDSFASIVVAIQEGRRIYQNLKKFIWYMFSSNIWELVVVTASLIFFMPQALTAILILCINLWTDILPALAMWVGPADRNNMNIPPRDPKARILEKHFIISFIASGIVIWACVVMLFLITLNRDGWTENMGVNGEWMHAVTVAFAGLVIIQMVNTFSAIAPDESIFKTNYLKNPYHLGAVVISVVFVLCIVYVPFLQGVLKTAPLTLSDWALIITMSIIPMTIMEIRKFTRKRLPMNKQLDYEAINLDYWV